MSKVDQAIEQLEQAGFTLLFASRPDEAPEDRWGRPTRTCPPPIELDLDDLLKFPKNALPVVFFYRDTLGEDDFQHSDLQRGEVDGLERLTVDLLSLEPKLSRFRKHLHDASEVELFAPYNGFMVVCHLQEAWYEEFVELRASAICQAEEHWARAAEVRRAAQAAQEQAALRPHEQRIRLLADDTGFLKLARVKSTAQRTLLSYANLQEPEAVAALGEYRMKELLGELRDWVLFQKGK